MRQKSVPLAAAAMAAFVLLLGVACSSGSKAGPASPGSGETHDAAGEKTAALTSQPVARPSGELSVAGVVKLAEPAVVKITTSTGVGSGFVVDEDGYIITNNHVIAGLSGRPSTSITVIMSDGAEYRASVVGADPRSDIALLKIEASGLAPLEFAPLSEVAVGQDVVAIGYALDLSGGDGPGFTVTRGIVSAKNRSTSESGGTLGAIQTDAAINHGNSGGPLLTLTGKVVGVNTSIAPDYTTGGVAAGIGFAVGSDMVKAVYEELRENGQVNRGLLGIQGFERLLPAKSRDLGVPEELGGVYLDAAGDIPDGPARRAGLRAGDVIVGVGGTATRNEADLAVAMVKHHAGQVVDVDIYRSGKKLTLRVTLGTPAE
ncbi:MAG: trypsin-like peptidase domain-containing protein [Dehalococcoidia bacterium]|nr:trypsin-like peptidase domain-containing protein [Dehalococcoidia bacterium]